MKPIKKIKLEYITTCSNTLYNIVTIYEINYTTKYLHIGLKQEFDGVKNERILSPI